MLDAGLSGGPSTHAKINTVDAEPSIAQITVNDLPAEFGPGSVLLDVRENDEWNRGHAADGPAHPDG